MGNPLRGITKREALRHPIALTLLVLFYLILKDYPRIGTVGSVYQMEITVAVPVLWVMLTTLSQLLSSNH